VKKSGTPIKLTGVQLMMLRCGLAHILWENPDDEELASVMRALPRPPLESPRIHLDGIKVRTIRVPVLMHDAYARAFRLVSEFPALSGTGKALRERAEMLEGMGGVERLGSIDLGRTTV